MAIFFTLLYVVAAYLAPSTLFGDFAQYHIQTLLALIALGFTLTEFSEAGISSRPQTIAIGGMMVCIVFSMAFNGLIGQSLSVLLDFLPNCLVFFFIAVNFRSKGKFKILVTCLFLVAVIILINCIQAVRANAIDNPWVLGWINSEGQASFRIRGQGFLNDPNDLSQFLVSLIPCLFIFWETGKRFTNLIFVYLPMCLLIFGIYLTHSRGGMVSLLVVVVATYWRKIGLIPAAIGGATAFAIMSVAGFSGGRDVNMESGADRMEAWSTGLQLIKHHPLFGVGFQRFAEYFTITAHNTVVVCAAEIGLIGFFFWMLLFAPTFRDLLFASKPVEKPKEDDADFYRRFPGARRATNPNEEQASAATPPSPSPLHARTGALKPSSHDASSDSPAKPAVRPMIGVGYEDADPNAALSDDEIRRLCKMMTVSLAAMFTAGWFLSRSYTMVLFLNIGLSVAILQIAAKRGVIKELLPMGKAAKLSGIAATIFIAIVYIMLKFEHFVPG